MANNTFALDLAAFAQRAPERATEVARKVSIDCLSRVVLRTPVGNPQLWQGKPPAGYVGGRARANWYVSIGAPVIATTPQIDSSGQATIAHGTATIHTLTGDSSVCMTNSLPYINELEFRGHSQQAPAGMVRITVTEFQTFVDAAVASLPP